MLILKSSVIHCQSYVFIKNEKGVRYSCYINIHLDWRYVTYDWSTSLVTKASVSTGFIPALHKFAMVVSWTSQSINSPSYESSFHTRIDGGACRNSHVFQWLTRLQLPQTFPLKHFPSVKNKIPIPAHLSEDLQLAKYLLHQLRYHNLFVP